MTFATDYAHVTLTVTDLGVSAAWYVRALGLQRVVERREATWERVVLRSPAGFTLGLTAHADQMPGDRFDETRVGLDHVSIACADDGEVTAWAHHFDALSVPRGEVVDAGYATVLVVRDPDGIPIEFFAPAA